ncbi:MAG: pyridoxal phosphate-dependent decarboxylase family protein [Planctomycetota bacterium]
MNHPGGEAERLADLELGPEDMRAMGRKVLERVVRHLASLGEMPICGDVDAVEFCRQLREDAPEEGRPLEDLLELLFDDCIPRSFTTPGPGYLAYIPGGGLYPAALAELISSATNRFTGIWQAAPALSQLEGNVLEWIRQWMSFPDGSAGLLTAGGSQSNLTAIICAREKYLGAEIRGGTVHASSQVHHSIRKAARLAGIMPDRVRALAVDGRFRLDVRALSRAIQADRRDGLQPFLVVSSAGTVNTGAVDPLPEIAELCQREGLWHHVDGAYGGFFHLCPELRPVLRGLEQADSLTLDPHKGLFLPYGTGALLVRDGEDLRAAHAASAGYLPRAPEAAEFYDASQHGPELSRPFRGLRVWLPVQLFGVQKLRAAILEKHELAVRAATQLAGHSMIRIAARPELSLFTFHLTWPGAGLQAENRATKLLIERVKARGRIMMSGCTTQGRDLARICVLSFRTRGEQVELCVTQVLEEAERILAEERV